MILSSLRIGLFLALLHLVCSKPIPIETDSALLLKIRQDDDDGHQRNCDSKVKRLAFGKSRRCGGGGGSGSGGGSGGSGSGPPVVVITGPASSPPPPPPSTSSPSSNSGNGGSGYNPYGTICLGPVTMVNGKATCTVNGKTQACQGKWVLYNYFSNTWVCSPS